MPTEMTDDEVLAELSEDERQWFPTDGPWNIPHGNCMKRERDWLRRLAATRRALRDAAAVERELWTDITKMLCVHFTMRHGFDGDWRAGWDAVDSEHGNFAAQCYALLRFALNPDGADEELRALAARIRARKEPADG